MLQLAQITNPVVPKIGTEEPGAELSALIKVIISALFFIGALIFIIMFLWGGIKWITSGGDKAQLESARTTILNAVIGLVILFSLFAILSLLGTLFDIDIFQLSLKNLTEFL
jgi:magnesium-transporting ATPase (P-type)